MRVMASIAREALEDAVRALGGDLAWPDSVNRPQTLNLKVEIDESDAWERLSQFVDIPRSEFDLRDLGDFAGAMVGGDTATALCLVPRLFEFSCEQEVVEASIRSHTR
ncbi:hypothetical protein [Sphingomonas sp.]|jgi:hypothetical protein|uniref:hypothetical protein n=1 Tax=Sphingomonas sp. TaxID=28214 RepID=UPI002EDA73B2